MKILSATIAVSALLWTGAAFAQNHPKVAARVASNGHMVHKGAKVTHASAPAYPKAAQPANKRTRQPDPNDAKS